MLNYTLGKKVSFIGIAGYAVSCIAAAAVDMLMKIMHSYDTMADLYMADFACNIAAAVFLLVIAAGYFLRWYFTKEKSIVSFMCAAAVGIILMSILAFMPLANRIEGLYGNFAYEYYLATVHTLYDSFIYSMATYFSPLLVSALMLLMSMRYSNDKKWLFISLSACAVIKALIAALTSSGKIAFMETTPVLIAIIVIELISGAFLTYADHLSKEEQVNKEEASDTADDAEKTEITE